MKISAQLPRTEQEALIAGFLNKHNMCVMATCRESIPRATPIEFYADGLTLYMMGDPGNKMENIRSNPVVSIGINDPLKGWMSIKGVQISGLAQVFHDDQSEYAEAMKIYQWQNLGTDLGWTGPPRGYNVIKVVPDRIEYLDLSLNTRGFSDKQVWVRPPAAQLDS
jgi:general stress protein 26